MNPVIKKQWVAALRSGEYQQTREVLKDSAGYCCLGVLCDLYSKAKNNGVWDGLEKQEGADLPSDEVVEWAGLSYENPEVEINGDKTHVSNHNDGDCMNGAKTFAEIADAIEAQL